MGGESNEKQRKMSTEPTSVAMAHTDEFGCNFARDVKYVKGEGLRLEQVISK